MDGADTTWTERPVNDKQEALARESYEYASANDLVLALKTADHLDYYYSTVQATYQALPCAELLLTETHLPVLHIPPTVLTEPFIGSQRIVGLLQHACSVSTDDEKRRAEDVVCAQYIANVMKRPQAHHHTKLDLPLLESDPDEDCEALRQLVSTATDAESRVRKHCLEQDCEEDKGLDELVEGNGASETRGVPAMAYVFARGLEASIQTETMAVPETAIRTLVQQMNGMKWGEQNQMALLRQQTSCSPPLQKHVSPPLTPVPFPIEYFVPSGNACLVTEPSDLSSGVSEALEEAEAAVMERAGDAWSAKFPESTDAGEFENVLVTHLTAEEMTPLDGFSVIHAWNAGKTTYDQEELPLSLSPALAIPNVAKQRLPRSTPSPVSFISDSDVPHLDLEAASQGEPLHADNNADTEPQFEEITEQQLLALTEDNTAEQARMPVPNSCLHRSPPPLYNAATSTKATFMYMVKQAQISLELCEWHASRRENDVFAYADSLDDCVGMSEAATHETMLTTTVLDNVPSWLNGVYDTPLALLAFMSSPTLRYLDVEEELAMDVPQKRLCEKPRTTRQEDSQTVEHKRLIPSSDNSWDDMMGRWKRRKKDADEKTGKLGFKGNNEGADVSKKAPKFTAPELLLGYNAFAAPAAPPRSPEQNAVQKPPNYTDPIPADAPKFQGAEPSFQDTQPSSLQSSVSIPKIIMSTTIPPAVFTHILHLLPDLAFVERDYDAEPKTDKLGEKAMEADLVVSPPSGLVLTTMVALRQTSNSPKRPAALSPFQERVSRISKKYEQLHILIYRSSKATFSSCHSGGIDKQTVDDLPEFSPSDAMAIAQLQGFVQSLRPCNVSVAYVSGGDRAAARWTADFLKRQADQGGGKSDASYGFASRFLTDTETLGERILRHAGLNVYDAQIVLGVLGSGGAEADHDRDQSLLAKFLSMEPHERLALFDGVIGCHRALEQANDLLKMHV